MVSTRSQSVLSADAAHGDTAASHGEVNSAAGPTPRRSGRLRSSGGSATEVPPTAARTARSRRHLKAIQEEEAEQQQAEQQAEQQQPAAGEQVSPRARRRAAPASAAKQPAAAAAAEDDASGSEEEGAGEEPLKAAATLVDRLAQEMFAALDAAFGQRQGSDSESDDEREAAAAGGQQQGEPAAAGSDGSSGSDDSDSEGEGAAHRVPAHLRWRPDLLLPGMGPDQQGQQQQSCAAPPAAAVHVVQRGGAGGLHVPPPDETIARRVARKTAPPPDTAGKGWFDLPATQITDEIKSDLRMLRLRGALDPKAHYKKMDATAFPKYFQLGTVVEGAADFYSGRLTNKQRKRTLTEEIMADEHLTQVRKKRFTKLQEERSQWSRKKHGRKTDNERRKKSAHRPKH